MTPNPTVKPTCAKKTRRPLTFTLGLVLTLGAASHAAADCDNLRGRPINPRVSWATQVKPIINEVLFSTGLCTSCHNEGQPFGGLDLSDTFIDAIYKIVDNRQVIPGDPLNSVLFQKVNCSEPPVGLRMPIGGQLSIASQELIYDWIAQGALGEPEEDPIPRTFVFRDGLESLR